MKRPRFTILTTMIVIALAALVCRWFAPRPKSPITVPPYPKYAYTVSKYCEGDLIKSKSPIYLVCFSIFYASGKQYDRRVAAAPTEALAAADAAERTQRIHWMLRLSPKEVADFQKRPDWQRILDKKRGFSPPPW
jgi:hypothetical protein